MKYVTAAAFVLFAMHLSRGIYLWYWEDRPALNLFALAAYLPMAVWMGGVFLDCLRAYWKEDKEP